MCCFSSSTLQALHFPRSSRTFCSYFAAMSSCCSVSSLRLFSTKIPTSLYPTKVLFFQPLKATRSPSFPRTIITFKNVPTKTPVSASASASSPVDLQPTEELPPRLREIVQLFQSVQEPKAKYEQLLFYGKNLKPLDSQFKTRQNKVEGCVSQVWVRAFLDEDLNVVYEADSDSVLTKGLAALLVQGLSGRPASEILRVSPDFVVLLGLQQSLTPSRNNGFLNMLKLMQKKALQLEIETLEGKGPDASSDLSPQNENKGSSTKISENKEFGSERMGKLENGSNSGGLGSRGMRIREKLENELNPIELEIEDVSYQHAGHAGVRGSGDVETHFSVRIVSKEFEGKSLVKRHRLVYDMLQEELQSGLHALSIVAKTPAEVEAA